MNIDTNDFLPPITDFKNVLSINMRMFWCYFPLVSPFLIASPLLICHCHTLMIGHHFKEFVLNESVPTGQ